MGRALRNLSIVIPAAGMGRRMKSYGPKPLIELRAGETVIDRQIRILTATFPHADITVVLGHEIDRVVQSLPSFVKVVENERHAETNVLRSIGMGLRVADHDSVLVVYGDLVFNEAAVAGFVLPHSTLLVDGRGQIADEGVGATVVDGRVTQLGYGLATKWAQVMLLTGQEMSMFEKISLMPDRRMHFGFEALRSVIEEGGSFRAIEPREGRLVEIDSAKDIERARSI